MSQSSISQNFFCLKAHLRSRSKVYYWSWICCLKVDFCQNIYTTGKSPWSTMCDVQT